MQENLYDKSNIKNNSINNISKFSDISEYKNYQKKKLDPIINININKNKTEINEKGNDYQNYKNFNNNKIDNNKNRINVQEIEDNKISEFTYKENTSKYFTEFINNIKENKKERRFSPSNTRIKKDKKRNKFKRNKKL